MEANIGRLSYHLPNDLTQHVQASLVDWRTQGKVRKLWEKDAALWTGADEDKWIGWLTVVQEQLALSETLGQFANEIRQMSFRDILLLGMGGSSLCPEVMAFSFGPQAGFPTLHILDSTDPAQVLAAERKVDLAHSLFIVASKSGSTLEPNIFKQYFFERVKAVVGAQEVGKRFIAITDPGSKMQQVAEGDGFRRIFFGVSSIGGRYSALSAFGMVPAAAMGIDVRRFLQRAEIMVHACGANVPPEENPGVILGTILGVAARHGRDKVTLITSPRIFDLGAWLEQLLAESTGKQGKGLVPIDLESLGAPTVYGNDRVFVYTAFASALDASQEAAVAALEKAGQPVVRITISDPYDLGQEFFRWEIATAVAGAIIGIHPFDQPDVEASKIETRQLTTAYEQTGTLPPEAPLLVENGLSLFTDERNTIAIKQAVNHALSLDNVLKAYLDQIRPGDYCGILAYIAMNDAHQRTLQTIRHLVRDRKRVATCLGFGPRFLHSTGQAYKGGPNSGVFLQITCEDAVDVPVPGQRYTFGVVKAAQARGDFQVLVERRRRALRVHLGKDVEAGLTTLVAAVTRALQ